MNWGMAAALGTCCWRHALVLYAVYARLVGIDRMRLG